MNWIKTTDALPESHEKVLVYFSDIDACTLAWYDEHLREWYGTIIACDIKTPTHWCEINKPSDL